MVVLEEGEEMVGREDSILLMAMEVMVVDMVVLYTAGLQK